MGPIRIAVQRAFLHPVRLAWASDPGAGGSAQGDPSLRLGTRLGLLPHDVQLVAHRK